MVKKVDKEENVEP